ncbi:RNA polymerase sigma factor [Poriferisphaera corsica]|uniref:RNA polymerase sigma factor n=1 Tax=Poriferisphaera corsica TaxID=2528020 RepID=UPI0011A9CBB5|nr:sigma-70 family RNA polymerase sigma factor [Poriferisphaera corsica]
MEGKNHGVDEQGMRLQTDEARQVDEQRAEEKLLLRRLQNGDAGAVSAMIAGHGDAVFRYVWGKVRDRHRAEDLTQECFMKAVRAVRKDGAKPREKVRAWLYVIARHVVMDYLRYKQRRGGGELSLEGIFERSDDGEGGRGGVGGWVEGNEDGPGHEMEMAEAGDQLKRAMMRLPEGQREVIEMRMWGEMSFGDIARTLDLPEATVKSRMRYGLAKLKEMLAGSCEKEVLL